VTEEFHPGFRNSVASYTVSLLNPQVITDMGLHGHGLRIVERPISNFLPINGTSYLKLGGGLVRTQVEFAKFSHRDAEALPSYYALLDEIGDVLRSLAQQTPPNLGDGLSGLMRALRQVGRLAALSLGRKGDLLDLFTESARSFLDGWFDSEPVKAAFGFDAVVGNYASPDSPGSAYVMLHHTFGEVNGKKGAWGHAIGGMGAITQAMAAEAVAHGARIEVEQPVRRVLVEAGRARALELESGRVVRARRIIANVNPRFLYLNLLDAADVPPEIHMRMQRYRCGSASFRMNVALSELPTLDDSGPAGSDLHRSGILIAPTLGYMDRAYVDARRDGMSAAPVIEMLIPSTVDGSLAPPGAHVASLFCQHFAPQLPGRHWHDARDSAAQLIIDTVDQYAPNFRRSILGISALSPQDLEDRFGLPSGDIFHGALGLDQLWAARPLLGHGDYRTGVPGLYLCGAGAHPGGGVSGIPGRNCAHLVLGEGQS
jgi:phytoene dehydrogenase-like protein